MEKKLEELCEVCRRVQWGDVARLGYGKWRHFECYPGSMPWLEYFKNLPAHRQSPEGKLLWKYRTSSQPL